MKTALLIGRNASGKSNFGSALFDITFGFPEAFDYSDLDDRLFLNADCGRGTAQFTYVFEFDGHEINYCYEKTSPTTWLHETLSIDKKRIFDFNNASGVFEENHLERIGAAGINFEFSDTSLSLLFLYNEQSSDQCFRRFGGVTTICLAHEADSHGRFSIKRV